MIPGELQPLANHLWQSTLFAAIAGLLTLALRRNRAQIRYCLWLSASVKFLIPFSLLVMAGSHFARSYVPAAAPSVLPAAVEQITQPFVVTAPLVTMPSHAGWVAGALPAMLCGAWAIGFLILVASWWKRWRRMHTELRTATAVTLPGGVRVLSSPAFREPGVFGVWRPVLLLPEGIAGELTSQQLEAILAHELCHIRRRDNLAMTIHMVVEALFWFHPLVWWLGARLLEERERACDEDVLAAGNEPEVYAEGILKICELYLSEQVPCVAGVTGANLEKRIEQIMSQRIVQKLDGRKKLLLAAAGVLALAAPIVVGTMHAPLLRAQTASQSQNAPATMKFEVASVKPTSSNETPYTNFPLGPGDVYVRNGGYFSARGVPLMTYILFAYKIMGNMAQYLIPRLPDWTKTENFDIEARAEGDPGKDEMRMMMRSLLAERFKMAVHYENRNVPVFAFVLVKSGKTGPQLQSHSGDAPCPTEPASTSTSAIVNGTPQFCNGIYGLPPSMPGRLHFGGRNVTIAFIADSFSAGANLGRPMVDQTGLSGRFDFSLEWAQDVRGTGLSPGKDFQPDPSAPTFEEALREQLGIKLQSTKASISVLVVDHVERPSGN
jgi:bla regulator protein blaR1